MDNTILSQADSTDAKVKMTYQPERGSKKPKPRHGFFDNRARDRVFKTSTGRFYLMNGQGQLRRCDEKGHVIKRVRMSKKMRLFIRRMDAAVAGIPEAPNRIIPVGA